MGAREHGGHDVRAGAETGDADAGTVQGGYRGMGRVDADIDAPAWKKVRQQVGSQEEGLVTRTKRRGDMGPHKPVPAVIATRRRLAQPRDPALGQANGQVDLARAKGRDHVSRARGKGLQGEGIRGDVAVALGEKEREGKVLGDVADTDGHFVVEVRWMDGSNVIDHEVSHPPLCAT